MTRDIHTPSARCPVCNQWPTINKDGGLHSHDYPWYHAQNGQHCPGSGTQTQPLPGQLVLPDQSDQGAA
jgi:hypothetical protein